MERSVTSDSETRRRMIEAASRLFQACGYRGTSWRQLVRESGTPWGSIQHHFPGGKEELGIAAVEHGAGLLGQFLESCLVHASSPAEALRTWFAATTELLESQDFKYGCAVAAVALDIDESTSTLQSTCSKAFESWEGILARGLQNSGIPQPRAQALATTCVAGFEGSLLLSRARRSVDPMRQTAEALCELVEQAVGRSRSAR
jgi:TetR/AcrR family transcriptional regulator, lmrAB and yxaGH operons repressor